MRELQLVFGSNLIQVEISRAGYSLRFPFFGAAPVNVGHEPGHIDDSRLGRDLLAQLLRCDNKRTCGSIGKRALTGEFLENCTQHGSRSEANLDLTTTPR
jgi:hypothetical protein